MAITQKYYVYELINPITMQTFYVGKGTGDRVYQHVKQVERNSSKKTNEKKIAIIQEILNAGKRPIELISEYFDTDEEAVLCEEETIAMYGIENLSNIMRKGAIYTPRVDGVDIHSIKLGAKMMAMFCNPWYKSGKTYLSDGSYIDALSLYNRSLELFNMMFIGKHREKALEILNKEIERRYTGRCLKVMY
jgi:hypothetical protein